MITRLRVWFARVAGLVGRGRRDARLQREIAEHLEALAADFEARGLSQADARRAARRAFGDVGRTREAYRDQGGVPFIDALVQDLRIAVRLLVRRPGFAALAISALALGIGVNSTFFTLVNAICFRGLPIERPDRVIAIGTVDTAGHAGGMSHADFESVRDGSTPFRGFAAHLSTSMSLGDEGRAPDLVNATYISADAFPLLGIAPARGRGFEIAGDTPGAAAVCLVSDLVWRTRYGADPALVGRLVNLDGRPVRVVGIMPPRFRFPAVADVWLPLASRPDVAAEKRDARRFTVFGRLRDTASFADARASLDALGARLATQYPDTNRDVHFTGRPINDTVNGNVRDTVWVAFITVGIIVLLVACANVANLLLMGALTRSHEIAVRASMGATRMRIVRQLLVESAVLAVLGGAVGIALAVGATRALATMVPPSNALPYWITFTIDGRVLVALVGMCVMTVLVCGAAPAIHASRARLTDAFNAKGQPAAAAFRMRRWTTAFLALEFALCFILLANLAGHVRDYMAPPRGTVSVETASLLIGSVSLPATRYPTAAAREDFYARTDERLRGLSGVRSLTFASHRPLGGASTRQMDIEGDDTPARAARRNVQSVIIGMDYFRTLGVSLVAGREFTDRDGRAGAEAVVVNEPFATTYLSGGEAVGRRLRLVSTNDGAAPGPWLTVVGVARPVRQNASVEIEPLVYLPLRLSAPTSMLLLARAAPELANPATLAPVIRDAVRRIDPDLPIYRVMPLDQSVREAAWNGRMSERVLYSVSAIAFVLALVGLYAVTAHTVAQRTSEIGLRMALGGTSGQMAWLVLRRVFAQLGAGILLGIVFSRFFEREFGNPAPLTDAAVIVPLIALIVAVASAACAVPALRAARIDPIAALRHE